MELGDYLAQICADQRQDPMARRLAERLLANWQHGLMPGRGVLRELRSLLAKDEPCGRLQTDGSCSWLRKNAIGQGLQLPGPGEKAYCRRRRSGAPGVRFDSCEGYSKLKE